MNVSVDEHFVIVFHRCVFYVGKLIMKWITKLLWPMEFGSTEDSLSDSNS
jgi:hypothetical protein